MHIITATAYRKEKKSRVRCSNVLRNESCHALSLGGWSRLKERNHNRTRWQATTFYDIVWGLAHAQCVKMGKKFVLKCHRSCLMTCNGSRILMGHGLGAAAPVRAEFS